MEKFAVEVSTGAKLSIDLKSLIVSRMLIVANSGGGKSHAIRKLAEVTHGHVQQIIIDTEGEFASLREKFDYVIAAAQGGDALAHPKTAKLLAERLLETGVSAIIDIYELKPHERHAFVRIFLESMVNAPKNLWHPVLVVLDEAHVYAPEKEQSEASGAVADIATRGRKRGFCLVVATQRLAKLSKDVAAELKNKLIGGMTLDVDVKRAAADLGMTPKDAVPLLRNLEAGHFYAFGPSIGREVREVHVGPVSSSHPKAGSKVFQVPKPTDAILAVLPKLADLPKEAEEKAKTETDLRRELADAKRKLTKLENDPVLTKVLNASQVQTIDELKRTRADNKRLRATVETLMKFVATIKLKGFDSNNVNAAELQDVIDKMSNSIMGVIERSLKNKQAELADLQKRASAIVERIEREMGEELKVELVVEKHEPTITVAPSRPVRAYDSDPVRKREGGHQMSAPQQRILDSLAWLSDKGIARPVKNAVAAVAGASPSSSAFANNLGALRSAGLIEYPAHGLVSLTATGAENADPPDTSYGKEVFDCWLDIVSQPQRKILEALKFTHPTPYTKESLAETAQASISSSAFANNLGALRTLGAIDYPRPGYVALTKHSMPE